MEGNKMDDLYGRDLAGARFRRLCGGNNDADGDGEACVEIAPIPGATDAYALRDSKNPAAGTLRFTGEELRAAGVATGDL